MSIEFSGKIWFWRGPAPWYFITVPVEQSNELKAILGFVTYGWGMIPADVRIGNTEGTTALFPKDGLYLVPIKASVRKAENLDEGDDVTVRLEVRGCNCGTYVLERSSYTSAGIVKAARQVRWGGLIEVHGYCGTSATIIWMNERRLEVQVKEGDHHH